MRMIYTLPIFAGFILACGGGAEAIGDMIPTPSGYQARLDALIGKPINVAVAELGAPTRTVDMAGGSRLYVWEEKSEMRTPITGEERYNPQTGAETIVINPSQRVPLDCFTELEADATGVVTRNRAKGIACVATPPGPGYASSPASASPAASAAPAAPAPPSAPPEVTGSAADVGVGAPGAPTAGSADGAFPRGPGAAVAAPRDPDARADRRAQRRAERAAARKDRREGQE